MEKIDGNNCDIKISGIIINGNNNTITGDDNTISGNNNTINGSGNTISGNNNKVKGDNNKVKGNNNDCKGIENKMEGNNNKENGKYINTDDRESDPDKRGYTSKSGGYIQKLTMNGVRIEEDDDEVRAYTKYPLEILRNGRGEDGNIVEKFLQISYTLCNNIEVWSDTKRKYISHKGGKKIVVVMEYGIY